MSQCRGLYLHKGKHKILPDRKALQESFIEIGESEEGKEIIAIYSHEGYKPADDKNYDGEREAQKLLRELKN